MKRIALLLMFGLLAQVSFSQITGGGEKTTKVVLLLEKRSNMILYSAGIPYYPFGIKYVYCPNFGFYVNGKTDFYAIDDYLMVSAGPVKTISQKISFYLGAGMHWYYDDEWGEYDNGWGGEGGLLFKFNRIGIDVGGGYCIDVTPFLLLGIGFVF